MNQLFPPDDIINATTKGLRGVRWTREFWAVLGPLYYGMSAAAARQFITSYELDVSIERRPDFDGNGTPFVHATVTDRAFPHAVFAASNASTIRGALVMAVADMQFKGQLGAPIFPPKKKPCLP